MHVSEAIDSRVSCRAFLDTPVPEETVRDILARARRAPSGGNLQPWHVHVLSGGALEALKREITGLLDKMPRGEETEYPIYPPSLKEPYRTRRWQNGMQLYDTLGIAREDKEARARQHQRNYVFFDAPVGMFFCIDRTMGAAQWSDMGMYIYAVTLLAREHGLHTCAQEAWAVWHRIVGRHIGLPAEQMLFCGLALGHMDERHVANTMRTERAPLEEIAAFHK